MFHSLVSNLPYSPGLIGQVSFYAKRLRQEEFIRRIGLIFTVLAMTIQMLTFFAPPEPSLASSTNDIIFGGGEKSVILEAYRTNTDSLGRKDIRAIFDRFGISEAAIAAGKDVTIKSYAENDFHSIGRNRRFSSTIERSVDIPGGSPVYIRPLHAWDSGSHSTYPALQVTTSSGQTAWILKNCGNIVLKGGVVEKQAPGLEIQKSLTSHENNARVTPGDELTYEIRYRNTGPGEAVRMKVTDVIPEHAEFVRFGATSAATRRDGSSLEWTHDVPDSIMGVTDWWHAVSFTARVSADAPSGAEICNVARISADSSETKASDGRAACVTVVTKDTPPAQTQPVVTCSFLRPIGTPRATELTRQYEAGADLQGATGVTYEFDFGDGTEPVVIASDAGTVSAPPHTYPAAGDYTVKVTVIHEGKRISSPDCETRQIIAEEVALASVRCDFLRPVGTYAATDTTRTFEVLGTASNGGLITAYVFDFGSVEGDSAEDRATVAFQADTPVQASFAYDRPGTYTVRVALISDPATVEGSENCLETISIAAQSGSPAPPPVSTVGEPVITYEKHVSNITQGIDDADGTTAIAGDILEYKLITRNRGPVDATGFVLPAEDLRDVTEYATILETGDGRIDAANPSVIVWNPLTVPANGSVEKRIRVEIKSPIPETPISASDLGSYDNVLSNAYGDQAVEVKVPRTVGKEVELVTKTLPETGPGAGSALSVAFFMTAAYFYARNRLIAKELQMIKRDFTYGH